MTTDILDAIEGAIRDCETSSDAMRWIPEQDRAPKPMLTDEQKELMRLAFARVEASLHAHVEAMKPALAQLGHHLNDCAAAFTVWFDEIHPWLEAKAAQRSRMHRSYHHRQLARRRRNR